MVTFNNKYIIFCCSGLNDRCNMYEASSHYKKSDSFSNIPEEMPTTFTFNINIHTVTFTCI